jgi:hypothetical protein
MFVKYLIRVTAAVCCLLALVGVAGALEVDSGATYCFSADDFSGEDTTVAGICITGLPDPATGTVMLGSRVIRSGDILTAEQLEQLTFSPLNTQEDKEAMVTYLPIYENRVEKAATVTISIRGKVDQPPAAEDLALETYKNLPNQGKLKVADPEGLAMTYTIVRNPRRGDVTVTEDGSFLYTPKKNKVGVDSFTYTATDPAGNVSREATVTIQILKPTDSRQYADTVGLDCRFTAEWMKNTGLFVGEQVGGAFRFNPEQTVTRGEFLAMALKALDIPVDEDATYTGFTDDTPTWLKPYLAAALRSGLTANWPGGSVFGHQKPVTGAEAALLLQNALALPVHTLAGTVDASDQAAVALAVMAENGVALHATENLTRGQVAQALYRVSKMSATAPGLQVLSRQQ